MTVPDGWEEKRLDEWGSIFSGSTPSTNVAAFWNGEIVWITPPDLSRLSSAYLSDSAKKITEAGLNACSAQLLPPGSIVLSSRAPIGYVAIPVVPFCTNQGCKTLKLKDGLDPRFAYYNILFNIDKIKNLGEGTTFAEVSKAALSSVRLSFPKRGAEQAKIADILETADRAIEESEKLIAKQQCVRIGLMQALLTRGIDGNGELRSESSHRFCDSVVGRIPEDWRVASVGELFELRREKGKPGLPIMSVVMAHGLVERAALDRRVETNLSPEGHALVLKGDITYNMMRMWQGVLGRANFDCVVSPAYVVLKPRDSVDSCFAEWLFRDERSTLKFRRSSRGVVDDRLRLYPRDLFQVKFAVPKSVQEQEEIAQRLEAINSRLAAEIAELGKLRRVRAGLMRDLLTGNKRVTALLEPQPEDERIYAVA
jgi:type I restriction enzyme S subunit